MSRLIRVSEVEDDIDSQQNFLAFAVDKSGAKTTLFFQTAKQATEWAIDFLTMNTNVLNVNVYGIELWANVEKANTDE